ncbi:hypothetical protein DYB26_009282 [Aphanomyces astaci]|uniref:Small ribosomal subunit protein mS29 n=2 Tax=Aphanomyces astaci TaxID=112090 RepID=A0A397EWB2_APHAT|nr:hypothetical protein DYB26_009282 [Aphanomyces astaci]RHZ07897.1 hypothetical protein DYB31_007134 [Aphanomyces astaci]
MLRYSCWSCWCEAFTMSAGTANKDTDVNKFFALTDEQIKKNFPAGYVVTSNPPIVELFELVEPNKHFMLRKPVATILSAILSRKLAGTMAREGLRLGWRARHRQNVSRLVYLAPLITMFVSVSLIQIVNFARENGWIVLHVPHARAWIHEAPYVTKSAFHEGKFDIDVVGADILKQLIQCNGTQLASLPLRGEYGDAYYPRSFVKKPKSASEYNKSDLTLLDICESGLKDDLLTCKAVVDLKAELAQVTEFPVLIAIDEYNAWFQKTVFGYEGVPVKAEDITVIDALRDVDASGYRADRKLANGLFIAATTENYPTKYDFSKQASYKRVRKLLHPYTPQELTSLVDYFHAINFRQSKYSDKDVVFLRLMTKGVPLKVFKQACIL